MIWIAIGELLSKGLSLTLERMDPLQVSGQNVVGPGQKFLPQKAVACQESHLCTESVEPTPEREKDILATISTKPSYVTSTSNLPTA
jgi:hypothetical protein